MDAKLKLISSMLIFGSIGVLVRNINLSSIEIAFLRAVIGSIFLISTGILIKQRISFKLIKKNILVLILSGAAIGINWIFLFQGYKYTTISNATLAYYFSPVFLMILSPIVLKEKLILKNIICIFSAMIGLVLILNVGNDNINNSYNHVLGISYALLGAVFYASVILMNKFIKDLASFETTLIQLIVSATVIIPVILYQNNINIINIDISSWAFIFILGIIHTGIAYLLYFTAIKELKGQSIAILSYIDPIFAVIISSIFLGETMGLMQIIGGVLILGSTYLSERTAT